MREGRSHEVIQGNYIALGYNMTRTEAPNDLGGRLLRKEARTTPEFPVHTVSPLPPPREFLSRRRV